MGCFFAAPVVAHRKVIRLVEVEDGVLTVLGALGHPLTGMESQVSNPDATVVTGGTQPAQDLRQDRDEGIDGRGRVGKFVDPVRGDRHLPPWATRVTPSAGRGVLAKCNPSILAPSSPLA